MKTNFVIILLIVAAMSTSLRASPNANSPNGASISVPDLWSLPLFGTGIKTNHEYTDINLFFALPVWSTIGTDGRLGGDYLFIEPYASAGTGGETAMSLGLGWRHLFSDEPVSALHKQGMAHFLEEGWFVGASLFVDSLNTTHDNDFWQLGVGVEIGTRYLELRGNYYVPLTGEKLADRHVSTRSFNSSSTKFSTTGSGVGDPYATGNQIAQDVNLTTLATTTVRSTTVRTVTEIFEKGMEGWDAEVSLLVPYVDQWADVRLIAGYYSFDNQPFGPQQFGTGHVHGWKAGVEIRPVPAIVLSGMWYEDARLTGENWTVGLQLQVPLDKTWKDAFKPRRRHLVEHLAEPVHRMNDAIKIGNKKEEESTASTSVRRITRVVSHTQQHLVLAEDIVFVNNDGPVGNGIQAGDDATGNGTAERPMATIQPGADIAQANSNTTGRGWKVYTQGTAAGYIANVTATAGSVKFIGSGRPIAGFGGKSFGAGPRPDVTGDFIAQGIPVFGVTGYTIHDGVDGITASDVGSVTVNENIIRNVQGIGVSILTHGANSSTALITHNQIEEAGFAGVAILPFDSSTSNATVTGNTIATTGATNNGILVIADDTSKARITAQGNTISDTANAGIQVQALMGAIVNADITGNQISRAGSDGIFMSSVLTSLITANLAGNEITTPDENGIRLIMSGGGIFLTLSDNRIIDPKWDGVHAEADGLFAGMMMTATGNSITGAGEDGFDLDTFSSMQLTAKGNTITDTDRSAFQLATHDFAAVTLDATGNTITQTGFTGFDLRSTESSSITASLTDNLVTNTGNYSLLGSASDSSTIKFTATSNSINGSAGNGLDVFASEMATLTAELTDNTIVNVAGHGISGTTQGDSTLEFHATGNTITTSQMHGISLTQLQNASLSADVDNNPITNAGQAGIAVMASSTVIGGMRANGNTITTPGGAGIDIQTQMGGNLISLLFENSIDGAGGNGVHAASQGSSTLTMIAASTTVTNASGFGFLITNADTATQNAVVGDSTISGTGNSGIACANLSTGTISLSIVHSIITGASMHGVELGSFVGMLDVILDRNSVTGFAKSGVIATEQIGSTLQVNTQAPLSTNNNLIGPAQPGFFRFQAAGVGGGLPSGTVRINGANHDASTTLP